jgi:hypothetical protein
MVICHNCLCENKLSGIIDGRLDARRVSHPGTRDFSFVRSIRVGAMVYHPPR